MPIKQIFFFFFCRFFLLEENKPKRLKLTVFFSVCPQLARACVCVRDARFDYVSKWN